MSLSQNDWLTKITSKFHGRVWICTQNYQTVVQHPNHCTIQLIFSILQMGSLRQREKPKSINWDNSRGKTGIRNFLSQSPVLSLATQPSLPISCLQEETALYCFLSCLQHKGSNSNVKQMSNAILGSHQHTPAPHWCAYRSWGCSPSKGTRGTASNCTAQIPIAKFLKVSCSQVSSFAKNPAKVQHFLEIFFNSETSQPSLGKKV